MDSNSPLIFIHYGNSEYLKFTFKLAKFFNRNKRIILLGDKANFQVANKYGIEHYYFKDFVKSKEIEEFNKNYQYIANEDLNREYWVNFVIKRWFIIHNFIRVNNINSFWTFDTDNLILSDLSSLEHKYIQYDCTEQCNGKCMNGYISNFNVVNGYINKILELFNRSEFLDEQRKLVSKNSKYAFTEMNAYSTYKQEESFESYRLLKPKDYECFDECLCLEQDFEGVEKNYLHYTPKQLYIDVNGVFYGYHKLLNRFVKLNSINMSWLPLSAFYIISEIVINNKNLSYSKASQFEKYNRVMLFDENINIKLFLLLNKIERKINKIIKQIK